MGIIIQFFCIITIFVGVIFGIIRKVQKKTTTSSLLVFLAVSALVLFFVCLYPAKVDEVALSSDPTPSYWQWLGKFGATLVEPEEGAEESFDPYIVTKVSKEGFGDITPDDIRFYMQTVANAYPDAAWTTISFSDGTGIEFQENSLLKVVYGTVDSDGSVKDGTPIDVSNPLINQIEGITTIEYEYDDHKNPIHELHLGADGKAVADANGVAEYFRKYDKYSHLIWEKRLGTDGEPALNASGSAELRREYDGSKFIRESYYDGNGNPVCLTDKLFASVSYERDDENNPVLEWYADEKGNPILSNAGCASIKRAYEGTQLISESFYGTDSEPVLITSGYASHTREYDENNNVNHESFYGVDGKPILISSGYASYTSTYDDEGHLLHQEHYGTDGKRTMLSSGYSAVVRSYDENWNINGEKFYDINDKPVIIQSGYASYARIIDENKNIIDETYFDTDGKAIALANGYAEVKREYKGSDLLHEAYYDTNGKPVNRTDILYASIDIKYDENHNRIQENYYDKAGKSILSWSGFATIERDYDENHNLLSEKYYGTDGKPVLYKAGYASFERTYDSEKNVTSESYYDTDGKPVNCIRGYASSKSEYNENRNLTDQKYFDADGNLTMSVYGYAEIKREYEDGQIVNESYYGMDGKPLQMAAGYYAISQKWDKGNLIERTYLDESGKAVERTDGYAKAVWEQTDEVWKIHFKDLNGKEVAIDGLNLVKDTRYDTDGWSEWLSPTYNVANSCPGIGSVNLGECKEGDIYTCSFEIEFKGVSSTTGKEFGFCTSGVQIDEDTSGDVWNENLCNIAEAPADGVYTYTCSAPVSEEMTKIDNYSVLFRCDYWKSGFFRVRNVKIEKGDKASQWSPGV